MSGVWLDVGFESLRGGKSAGDATRDRSRRWQAVAAAEDEVLICVCAKLVEGRIPPPRNGARLTADEDLDGAFERWYRGR